MTVSRGEKKLTNKQEKFCLEFVRVGNATEAYRLAYDAENMKAETIRKRSSELMNNGDITGRIAKLREEVTAPAKRKLKIDKEWVLEQLVENVSMAKSAAPVLDADGAPTGEYKQNLAAANKALELIGKEFGMFIDRKEIRTGALEDISHEDRVSALEAVRNEIAKRKTAVQVH